LPEMQRNSDKRRKRKRRLPEILRMLKSALCTHDTATEFWRFSVVNFLFDHKKNSTYTYDIRPFDHKNTSICLYCNKTGILSQALFTNKKDVTVNNF
jgi:hypothetical protein